jgi:antitoxin component of MazEF toxin-antitoxin module
MKVTIRRVGNSLGVILPKSILENWGMGEGDSLELSERGILAASKSTSAHQRLDELKRLLALAVVRHCTSREIRARSLANLHRWKKQGTWVSAYDEWKSIMENADDGELFAAMLGTDENATRLRQSMPFVGLLSQQTVRELYEEAGA